MYSQIKTLYLGELSPLTIKTNKYINSSDLKLFKYDTANDEWIDLEVEFTYLTDNVYKTDITFNDIGLMLLKVVYQDITLDEVVVNVKENLLKKLYEYEVGNWQIKDNQMLFYDLDGNIIAKYNLYDKYNKPTDDSVYLREKV